MKTKQTQKNPSDWQQVILGDIFTFIRSHAFSRDNLSNGLISGDKIGNIHYGDIHSTYKSPNIDISKIEIPLIKDKGFIPHKDALLRDGDLVMADASEDYEGVGVTVSIHGIKDRKVVGGLHTFVLRDEKGLTNEYYRQYIFRNPKIRNIMQKTANGVSVYGVSKKAVSKIKLPLPPLPEQNRIVSVLETWDRMLEKLTKKIQIKKQIKKGLMQELLTGKKRLKGFSDKWETKKLGDISIIKKGESITKKYVTEGDVPVIAGGKQPAYYHNKSNRVGKTITISASGAYAGYIDFYNQPIFVSDCTSIKEKDLDINFIYFYLKLKQQYIYSLQSGGAQPHVQPKDLQIIKIYTPKSKKEQSAIAQILTTADKEINRLEDKLKILKEQKRYLLNNLITGTIRTPKNNR